MSTTPKSDDEGFGHERLWGWFGLSYASFLTLPRVLMHQMPDEWQGRMAKLLEEYDAAYPMNQVEPLELHVSARRDGKYCELPDELKHYRHPRLAELQKYKV